MWKWVLGLSSLLVAAPLPAAWLTFTNDTKETLLVRELVTVQGKAVPGKAVKLVPGETLRAFQPGPVAKTIQILENKQGGKVLNQTDVTVKDKDVSVSIAAVKGQVKLVPKK